jgi:hypothetical protein
MITPVTPNGKEIFILGRARKQQIDAKETKRYRRQLDKYETLPGKKRGVSAGLGSGRD